MCSEFNVDKFVCIISLILLLISDAWCQEESETSGIARKKGYFKYHALWHWWGVHALAILFWVKVKVIIVAFIIGTAIVWAARTFWYHKSCPEALSPGTFIPLEHGIHEHIDHVPYSSYPEIFHGHEPYGAYTSYGDLQPDIIGSIKSKRKASQGRQNSITEDQISEMVFMFLGVDSEACRKRFLCELEFKSQNHPLTRIAFKIFGHGLFMKYISKENDTSSPKAFEECAQVHDECKIIEENIKEEEPLKSFTETDTFTANNVRKRKRKQKSNSAQPSTPI